MTQASLFTASKAPSLVEKLAQLFRANPERWIDGMQLADIAGRYAWRSRVSDLRKRGMVIENRERKVNGFTVSEYRYVPAAQQEVA